MQIQTIEFSDVTFDRNHGIWHGAVVLIARDQTAHFACRARLDEGALLAEVQDRLLDDALRQASRMPENRKGGALDVTDPMRAKLIRAAA